MSERAFINQGISVAPEVTPGTAPASGFYEVLGMQITPGVQIPRTAMRATGRRFVQFIPPNKDWSQASVSGGMTYNDIGLLLAMQWGAPTTATPVAGVNQHVWDISVKGTVTPKYYSVEQGESGAGNARRFSGAFCPDIGFDVSADACNLSGQIVGRKMTVSTALTTSGLTALNLVSIDPPHVSLWSDSVSGSLGTTQLTEAMSCQFRSGGFHAPFWVLNRSLAGTFKNSVNATPNIEFTIMMEANAAGLAYVTNARSRTRSYIMFDAQGGVIGATTYVYALKGEMCCEVQSVTEFQNQGEVYAYGVTFGVVEDHAWGSGRGMRWTLTNDTAVAAYGG